MKRCCFAAMTIVAISIASMAYSDEVVRTVDGRTILLRSDGTYDEIKGLGPAALQRAVDTAATYGSDKGSILACLEHEPDGPEKMRTYFANDEQKTQSFWLSAGGSKEEWSKIESAFTQSPTPTASDCAKIMDSWARFEPLSMPLSFRSPFREMEK